MDKSWIYIKNRLLKEYKDGVKKFIELARNHLDKDGKCRCPCKKCMNFNFHHIELVERHLHIYGFRTSYVKWAQHGEDQESTSHNAQDNSASHNARDDSASHNVRDGECVDEEETDDFDDEDEMLNALNDAFPHNRSQVVDDGGDGNEGNAYEEESSNFADLFAEAGKELYSGCTKFSALSFIIKMLHRVNIPFCHYILNYLLF